MKKIKLLYATHNHSKIYNMKRRLEGLPIEIVTPKDLGIQLEIVEDGQSAIVNAIKKAQAYFEYTHIPTIGADSGLYIENIPEEKQPGLFVRRVNGQELSVDEMIEYYTHLIESIGGQTVGYYITGLALMSEKGLNTIEIKEDAFILTSKIFKHPHRENPLDTITIDPITQKYYTDLTDEDMKTMGFVFEKRMY